MNNYIEEARKRSQNLLIVEGKHEKDDLFKLLFRCFPEMKISMDDIWIYGTNIYMLYDDIVKEYGEQWDKDDIDLPFVISKKQGMVPLRYKEDFTNIILIFDYERHDIHFSEDKIIHMQKSFIDSTDMGKLYINYPMIESYQHLCSLPDKNYSIRKIPVSLQPGKEYKSLVRKESVIKKYIEYPQRLEDLLKEHFEISDNKKRKECCEQILTIESDENIREQLHSILSGIIKEKWADTANYQLEAMIKKVKYAYAGQTFWNYMRDIFRQIILHNIFKAIRIQYDVDIIDKKECRDDFERIDLNEILAIQNAVSKDDEMGFIWILCTCIFLVPEYNFSLVS